MANPTQTGRPAAASRPGTRAPVAAPPTAQRAAPAAPAPLQPAHQQLSEENYPGDENAMRPLDADAQGLLDGLRRRVCEQTLRAHANFATSILDLDRATVGDVLRNLANEFGEE